MSAEPPRFAPGDFDPRTWQERFDPPRYHYAPQQPAPMPATVLLEPDGPVYQITTLQENR